MVQKESVFVRFYVIAIKWKKGTFLNYEKSPC